MKILKVKQRHHDVGEYIMKNTLFLLKVVDDMLAVLSVGTIGNMYPVGALPVVLPDELVEVAVRLDPLEPPLALLQVAVDTEVCGLTLNVLGVADTAHGLIEARAAVAAANLDRFLHCVAKRLEYVVYQRTHGAHFIYTRGIDDAEPLGGRAVAHLFEGEVLANSGRHRHRLYESPHWYLPSVSSPQARAR